MHAYTACRVYGLVHAPDGLPLYVTEAKGCESVKNLHLMRLRQRPHRIVLQSTGLSGQPGERQPRRKKGKGTPPAGDACSLRGLAHAALGAVLCTLGACTDAARLGALSGESCEAAGARQLQHESSAELAVRLLKWTMQLPEDALSGMADVCWCVSTLHQTLRI